MAQNSIGSVLAVDFGSVTTRALLFDVVDGEYRLVARGNTRTTFGYPIDDVNVGLERILADISEVTGRRFFGDNNKIITPERADRSGVDYFVTTASAGRPMRVVMVGLVPEISVQTAIRATASSYVQIVGQIHLDDGLTEEDRLNILILQRPDLVFIVGGTDGGARSALLDMVSTVKLASSLIPERLRPTILYAGNAKIVDQVRDIIGDTAKLFTAPNVQPTETEDELEPAQVLLGQAFDEYKERNGFSFRNVAEMSNSGILPTAQSYAMMTEFYARMMGVNAIALDVGSATSTLAMYMNGDINSAIRTDIGIGHSAKDLLDLVGEDAVAEWLPFYPQPDELVNYVLNKGLRPATIPIDEREMYIELGLLRAGIRRILGDARLNWNNLPLYGDLPEIGLIIGAGAPLTGTGYAALDMLLLVDTIQPTGITQVKADPDGVIPALGALAIKEPRAVVQLLDSSSLEHLGTIISVSGSPKVGSRAISLKIKTTDGEVFEHEVAGGEVWHLPLPSNVSLDVEIKVARGLTIGKQRKLRIKLLGGTGGVLFDTRGRPLSMGATPAERAENMPQWMAAVTEQAVHNIPDNWLIEPEAVESELQLMDKASKSQTGKPERTPMRSMSTDTLVLQESDDVVIGFLDHEDNDDLDFSEFEDDEDDEVQDDLGSLRELL